MTLSESLWHSPPVSGSLWLPLLCRPALPLHLSLSPRSCCLFFVIIYVNLLFCCLCAGLALLALAAAATYSASSLSEGLLCLCTGLALLALAPASYLASSLSEGLLCLCAGLALLALAAAPYSASSLSVCLLALSRRWSLPPCACCRPLFGVVSI